MLENKQSDISNSDSLTKISKPIGPLMLDIAGLELTEGEKQLLASPVVGGLILFSRNYENPEQLRQLMSQVRAVCPDLIVAVDHEGGRVQRFRDGFTRIPPMSTLNKVYSEDESKGCMQAYEFGWIIASELGAYDIDISFTPVLDRDYGVSQVIGDRAFSGEIKAIVDLSSSLIKGMRASGMASTGKHFPGHGAVVADSHLEVPVDDRAMDVIRDEDMAVFSELIPKGLDAIMPAHVIYSQVDDKPAGFSKIWMQDILRKELGFEGVIFSDDLSMEGASVAGGFTERADAALEAGCDMVLVCNNPDAANQVRSHFESLVAQGRLSLDNPRLSRMRLKSSLKLDIEELHQNDVWKKYNNS